MTLPFARAWREWRELRRFTVLPEAARALVFYAEDGASWVHLGPIVRELTGRLGREVCYLTSSAGDPVLRADLPGVRAFCIGEGTVRTQAFAGLRAGVLVMTMPDLQTFHIKRSPYGVHYVYVHHSLVSTHMAYRPGAFDHFDSILCAGSHHVREIRATEAHAGLPAKRLVEHGYARVDELLASRDTGLEVRDATEPYRVLLAPSWGPHGLLERGAEDLVAGLLEAGYAVTVRPHPMTARTRPDVLPKLRARFEAYPAFVLDADIASDAALRAADVMISDWSGVAMEYAFGLERPVLFIDTPPKVNNPGYEAIGCVPLEVSIREEIGLVVAPDDAPALLAGVERLRGEGDRYIGRIRRARDASMFHVGDSARVAADYLARLADERAAGRIAP